LTSILPNNVLRGPFFIKENLTAKKYKNAKKQNKTAIQAIMGDNFEHMVSIN